MSFWDKVLGPTTPAAPQQQTYSAPTSTPWFVPAGSRTSQAPVHAVPIPSEYTTTKNDATKRLSGQCPECGSGNLYRPANQAMEHCYECGWNPRFSLAGVGVPYGSGDSTATKQISTDGYNPGVIVGRIAQ